MADDAFGDSVEVIGDGTGKRDPGGTAVEAVEILVPSPDNDRGVVEHKRIAVGRFVQNLDERFVRKDLSHRVLVRRGLHDDIANGRSIQKQRRGGPETRRKLVGIDTEATGTATRRRLPEAHAPVNRGGFIVVLSLAATVIIENANDAVRVNFLFVVAEEIERNGHLFDRIRVWFVPDDHVGDAVLSLLRILEANAFDIRIGIEARFVARLSVDGKSPENVFRGVVRIDFATLAVAVWIGGRNGGKKRAQRDKKQGVLFHGSYLCSG